MGQEDNVVEFRQLWLESRFVFINIEPCACNLLFFESIQ